MIQETDILKRIKRTEEIDKKTRRRFYITTFIILFTGVISFYISHTISTRNLELETKQKQNQVTIQKLTDSIKQYTRVDTIKNILNDYLSCRKDSINCTLYYANTVENYSGWKNATIKEIIKSREAFYKSDPRAKYDFNIQDFTIGFKNDTALIHGKMTIIFDSTKKDDSQSYDVNLKINKSNKIFYMVNTEEKILTNKY